MIEPLHDANPRRLPSRDILLASALLALSLGLIGLWLRPAEDFTDDRRRLQRLESRAGLDPAALEALRSRIDALERRQPKPSDAADARNNAPEAGSARELGMIAERLTTLENSARQDQRQMASRLDALEARVTDDRGGKDLGDLRARVDRLERSPISDPRAQARIDELTARLARLEVANERVSALADRVDRVARLRAIETALAAGQKLGEMPGLPDALGRFAHAGPPTEAALRAAFPAVERAVRAALTADSPNGLDGGQLWERVKTLITVRRGDGTAVGRDTDSLLESAGVALQRGDLAGAERAVAALPPRAQTATEPWLGDARAILAARAALRDLLQAER